MGLALIGATAGEHLYRRLVEQRWQIAVADRQRLERQVSGVLAAHQQLTGDVTAERQRTQTLSTAITEKHAQLDQAIARLAEEERTVRELHIRVATMQQQMDQLQGELALAIQERKTAGASARASAVQLERIVVSQVDALTSGGRILTVHQDWNFVVIDLGWDTVKIGDTVSIIRDNEVLAKAQVERVQERVAAATILPGWEADNIRVNDRVQM